MKRVQGRWLALAVLTALVLAVHLLLLRASPGAFDFHDPLKPSALVLRTIRAQPPPPPPPLPVLEQKKPPAPIQPAPVATKSIATAIPAPAPAPEAKPEPPAPAPPAEPTPAVVPQTAAASSPSREIAQAPSFAVPGSVRLNYDVVSRTRGARTEAKSQLVWRHDGTQYDARWETKGLAPGERAQRSAGRITAEGLAPLRFAEKASRSEEAAHFRRDKGLITFSNNQQETTLRPGAQDRLSVLMQLGALIAADPSKYPPQTAITVQTAGTSEAGDWIFVVDSEVDLELPGGTVRALKLLRAQRGEFDQKVELWLGIGMDYVPVRLRLTSPNEDWTDQQWSGTDRP